ncbi:hypothetical protein U1839_04390 [Sphingomonas sp. RT2P30]|uniref:hypothetical protein n=1 Tax=Parasphingomonas halimpatiens TaxID=3096162 RepID=UPI002FCC8089
MQCVVNRVWSMPAIVERSDLIAILPDWFIREIAGNFDLASYKLPVPIPQQNLYLTWLARHADDPGHHWLRTTLIEAFHAHLRAGLPGPSQPVQGSVVGTTAEGTSVQPLRGNARE